LRLLALLLAATLSLAGCASLPQGEQPDPRDHFERFNRSVYIFNTKLDHAVLRPVARGYVKITPLPVRTSVHNFVENLAYSRTIVNDFLQGKLQDGASDTLRLIINTVFGLGGLFDTATRAGLDRHHTEFGQTLGIWGVHSGSYLVLPLFGPSTVRDAIALVPDEYLTPSPYIRPTYVPYALSAIQIIDLRVGLLDTDKLLDSSYDPYVLVRSVYLQRRDYLIHGDASPAPDEPFPDQGDGAGSPTPRQ
jgi:phospholipid-binding lipoprotein MlaA